MRKKTRKRFTQEQKNRAIDEYLSGKKTAQEVADELDTGIQNIYRWKVQREEKAKGVRIEELISDGNSEAMAKKLLEKELEIEMYQKIIAELTLINDLLKKIPGNENFQPESELTGLIRTTSKSARKRKPVKR